MDNQFLWLRYVIYAMVLVTADSVWTKDKHRLSLLSKTKVDTLGEILKKRVEALKNVPGQRLDLVFLVDSSASVGIDNFNSEIKFVHKLLADHTVSYNKTRVALVTFSSRFHVIPYIDHISRPNPLNNKCKMLAKDTVNITYSGGGTFTLGALMEAQRILENGRTNASRAVFLITDGYSNGGDPRPAAKKLKEIGVQIFTFGIQNGNVQELKDMATEPKNEHCYILDSFEEFEALARRALHQDLHVGDHEIQEREMCNNLCQEPTNDSGCCDSSASCSCGTHIGHYICRCPQGYYGSGLVDDCLPCPIGTYGESEGLTDINDCTLCPEQRNISDLASTSIHHCRCHHGFQLINDTCTLMTCKALVAPVNGHFVNNKCGNVLNSACGIRCDPGYKAVGSSIRICREDGEWSGQETECHIKHCFPLTSPRHGSISCDLQDFRFQTRCNFSCEDGFSLIGSKSRQCLAISSWDGIPAHCRSITCPPLTPPVNGSIIPSKCAQHKSQHGDTCGYSCSEGFILMGARKRQCGERGRWSFSDKKSYCADVTPPNIQCPANIVAETDLHESFASVTWEAAAVNDNSGMKPIVVSIPVTSQNTHQFPIGVSIVTLIAEDKAGNKANCSFEVEVKDNQSPIIDQCDSPPTFLVNERGVVPIWEEPTFSDNSGQTIDISSSHNQNSTFKFGKTLVTYIATDAAGNNSTCVLEINLQEDRCRFPFDPIHGHPNCSSEIEGTTCSITCEEGYAFAFEFPTNFMCAHDGSWSPSVETNLQDCAVTSLPTEATKDVVLLLQSDNIPCDDAFFMHQVENKFQRKLDVKLDVYCLEDSLCNVTYISAECEEYLAEYAYGYTVRRRRDVAIKKQPQLVAIHFQLNVSSKNNLGSEKNTSSKLFHLINSILDQMRQDARKGELDLQMGNIHLTYNKIRTNDTGPAYMCPVGSVLRRRFCVKCPVGTFYNVIRETCQRCSRGTYQFQQGQLSCLVCPQNTSTSQHQIAKSIDDCKAQCIPGTFSADGLEPCQTCKKGYFNPRYAKTECTMCPSGMSTSRRGARNETNCKNWCNKNSVSQTGLEPCYPCPPGYLQPSPGMTLCLKCLDLDNKDVELPINDCFSVPCLNGASCLLISFGYVCDCASGYTGMNCETDINECESEPCRNGGKCIDVLGNFKCLCQPGYEGTTCEEDIDDCASSPCLNGGKCVDWINDFQCDCPIGFIGKMCENSSDDCVTSPCLNGAICVQEVGRRRCVCSEGFAGEDCQINIDKCKQQPCLNGGTCYEHNQQNFSCQCPEGFSGFVCEINLDECQSQPCLNGGTCEDQINDFLCHCPIGFAGNSCQIKLSNNFVMGFAGNGISDYAQADGFSTSLNEVSFCLWLRTNDNFNYGTLISYAVETEDNALTLTDANGFVLYVNGEKVITDVTSNDGNWHLICVTWLALNGSWAIYKDGYLGDSGTNLSDSKNIPGGGSLIVGQEQDQVNGGFSQAEAFVGYLGWINFWNRILTETNIKALMITCGEYVGNVKGWPEFLSGLRGRVRLEESNFCKGCANPEEIINGIVSVNGTVAYYECNVGYTLKGQAERLCMIHGNWSKEKPECQRISCGFPGYLENGFTESNGFKYLDVVNYKCKSGFRLEGTATRLCQKNGQWSGNSPECIQIYCPFLAVAENGYLNYTSYDEYPTVTTTVTFHCFHGFQLNGIDTLHCTQDGSWDEDPPLCQPVFCDDPPKIPNGYVVQNSVTEVSIGDFIEFECDIGYWAYPPAQTWQMTCSDNGQWVGEIPHCIQVDCGEPPSYDNANPNWDATIFNSIVNYSCIDGYQATNWSLKCSEDGKWIGQELMCKPVECPMLQSIRFGEFVISSLHFNETATYSCMDSYLLKGESTRRCLATGHWSGMPPSCSPIICQTPIPIANGEFGNHQDQYLPGFVLTVTCNAGYQRVGPSQITCLENGNWSQVSPNCSIIECTAPEVIANGYYNGSEFSYGSNISYWCDEGYTLIGESNVRTCKENQKWSGELPECQIMSCESVNNIKNGRVYFKSFEYMTEIHYVCNKGFKLEGTETRACLSNGSWTGKEPLCVLSKCPKPESVNNGQMIVSDTMVQYTCDQGYILQGDSQNFCDVSEVPTWIGTKPICIRVLCREPDVGENVIAHFNTLNYGSVVKFECLLGYKNVNITNSDIICQSDGSWSGKAPICEKKACPHLNYLLNGKIMSTSTHEGAVVQFECDSDYKMIGERSIFCTENETWSGEMPKCVPVTCPWPIPQLKNGFLFTTGFAVNDEVTYDCHEGYELVGGFTSRMCLTDGTWTGSEPACLPVNCGPPDESPHNLVYFNNTIFNSVATYNCPEDFQLIGDEERMCMANRMWSSSAPKCQSKQCNDPPCVQKSCGQPPILKDGYLINFNSSIVGSTVSYACDEGFTMEGSNVKVCDVSQKWLPYDNYPVCIPIECPVLSYLQNGYYLYSYPQIKVGSTVTAECENDFYLMGSKVRMCTMAGTWTDQEALCVRLECPNPQFVDHASFEIDGTFVGANIRYQCNKGYYTINATVLTCMSNGEWNSAPPKCNPITCAAPPTVENGSVIDLGHELGQVIYIRCNVGFHLVNGSAERVCEETGTWNGNDAVCEEIKCDPLSTPFNGNVTVLVGDYTKIANYSCEEGYRLVGNTQRFCQEDGRWNGITPHCQTVQCEPIESIVNGWLFVSNVEDSPPFSYRTSVSFKCNRNYKLNSSDFVHVECLSTGEWSGRLAKCVRAKCDPWPLVAEALVSGDISLNIGSTITYHCRQGFQLIGQSDYQCLESGVWDGSIPKCVPVLCSQPPEVDNATTRLFIPEGQARFSFGASITYNCKDGFELEGSPVLTCDADGKWMGGKPTCIPMLCPPPPVVSHSTVQVENYEHLSRAIYICEEGFVLKSTRLDSVIQCLPTREWETENKILCEPIKCSDLPPIVNGAYLGKFDSVKYGSIVHFNCTKGYHPARNGKLVAKCSSSGTWLGKMPRCRPVTCPLPEQSLNSLINNTKGNIFESKAFYSCLMGFKLEGNSERICRADGKWSGEVPRCLRKSVFIAKNWSLQQTVSSW